MPYAFGAVYFILEVLSTASPPEEAVLDVTVVVKALGLTPFGFSTTPVKTNVLTPLLSGPAVVIYDTSIRELLSTCLPNTPSPSSISYLWSSISSTKNTFELPSTPKMLSATLYSSLNEPPPGYTCTLIVLVSIS